jgi:hypothetical protein
MAEMAYTALGSGFLTGGGVMVLGLYIFRRNQHKTDRAHDRAVAAEADAKAALVEAAELRSLMAGKKDKAVCAAQRKGMLATLKDVQDTANATLKAVSEVSRDVAALRGRFEEHSRSIGENS